MHNSLPWGFAAPARGNKIPSVIVFESGFHLPARNLQKHNRIELFTTLFTRLFTRLFSNCSRIVLEPGPRNTHKSFNSFSSCRLGLALCIADLFPKMSLSTLSAPAKRRRVAGTTSPWFLALLEDVGSEDGGANQQIFLITVSRVLPEVMASAGFRDVETLTRAELRDMVRDAFDDPVHRTSVGRPRACTESKVEVAIVAREYHADGSAHFHVVVKLNANMRFKQAKLTLRMRHKLPSHWSCTHRQLWSALRYLFVATPKD